MVSILKNRDYEVEIYNALLHRTKCEQPENPDHHCSLNELARTLHIQTNIVSDTLKTLVDNKLLIRIEGKPYPYHIVNPQIDKGYFPLVVEMLKIHQAQIEFRIKKLSKKKIFKNLVKKKKNNKFPKFQFNERITNDYDAVIHQINQIINISSSLPFAQTLGLIPKNTNYEKQIRSTQKEVNNKANSFIKQICSDHKEHEDLIMDDLKLKITIFNHLQSLLL